MKILERLQTLGELALLLAILAIQQLIGLYRKLVDLLCPWVKRDRLRRQAAARQRVYDRIMQERLDAANKAPISRERAKPVKLFPRDRDASHP